MNQVLEKLTIGSLYADLSKTVAESLLERYVYPWEVLPAISEFILELGSTLSEEEYEHPAENVWISKRATVAPSAFISGPCIICEGAEIRHCAFIRGSAIVGRSAVVGNSTELKNCILFDNVQVPHFNYVGDSILGYKSHLGAGAVTSNVKSDKTLVTVRVDGERVATERKKFGAMVGDLVEVGCHTVLNPGTVIGSGSNIYPLSSVRGYVPKNSIYKSSTEIVQKQ